ncbi:MAG TPA: hypothetical protein VLJ59_10905 [Mycobacteriales bacterium]|nr:hypothetical protein [Mycobacteriales bacterium]
MTSRRTAGLAALLAAGMIALTGCQPSTGTAAFVGAQRITERQLQAAVDEGLALPGARAEVIKQSGGDLAEFRRSMLQTAILSALVDEAARRTGAAVTPVATQQLISSIGGAEGARQRLHVSTAQLTRLAYNRLLVQELGYVLGGVQRPTDQVLRQQYLRTARQQSIVTISVVQVGDMQELRAVVARLRADPGSLAALAKQYAKYEFTRAQPQTVDSTIRPESLFAQLVAARPGDVVPFVGPRQFVAFKVVKVSLPTFQQARGALLDANQTLALNGGFEYLVRLSGEFGVRVNPRYGAWTVDRTAGVFRVDQATNPVLRLGGASPPPDAPPPSQ